MVSAAGGLRAFDARSGIVIGSAPFEDGLRYLFPDMESGAVVAVTDSTAFALSLPSFGTKAKSVLKNTIYYAAARGNSLLLLLRGGEVCLVNLATLSETSSFNWGENPSTKGLSAPRHACVSPDGKLVLLHGGSWWQDGILWDRRHDPPTFTAQPLRVIGFQFSDNTHFATWFVHDNHSEFFSEFHCYDAKGAPVESLLSQRVPNDDTQGYLQLRAWSGNGGKQCFGFVGPSGLAVMEFGAAAEAPFSDRYVNLLPNETGLRGFLAVDLSGSLLALRSHGEILLFRRSDQASSKVNTQDYTATACRDGLLRVTHSFTPTSVRLSFSPFNPLQKPALFSLQWPADSRWMPWAMATTPDAGTVAVIARETDSYNTVGSRYGRVRALIYHPGDLMRAPSAWRLEKAFEVAAPPGDPLRDNLAPRFAVLDPEAHVLLYWSHTAEATYYNTLDGKPVGHLELGVVAVRSSDGRRVAAMTPTDRLRVYALASGKTLLDLGIGSASALCFSADGSRIVAAQTNMLTTYDIASGSALSSVRSPLEPLAYPPRGNRFLAFQPEGLGSAGALVLADTADARATAVINRSGSRFTPAFFSDSGEQLAIVRSRWHAEVVRSLRPEDLSTILSTPSPQAGDAPQPLPPTNIVTTAPVRESLTDATTDLGVVPVLDPRDGAALLKREGRTVKVRGKIIKFAALGPYYVLNFTENYRLGLTLFFRPADNPTEFSSEEIKKYVDKTVVVEGQVTNYQGRAEIIMKSLAEIKVQDEAQPAKAEGSAGGGASREKK